MTVSKILLLVWLHLNNSCRILVAPFVVEELFHVLKRHSTNSRVGTIARVMASLSALPALPVASGLLRRVDVHSVGIFSGCRRFSGGGGGLFEVRPLRSRIEKWLRLIGGSGGLMSH